MNFFSACPGILRLVRQWTRLQGVAPNAAHRFLAGLGAPGN